MKVVGVVVVVGFFVFGLLIFVLGFVLFVEGVFVKVGNVFVYIIIMMMNFVIGKIKYVWFIILENKFYDENFIGFNQNFYLWKEFFCQGVFFNYYYGIGYYFQDNYIIFVLGQVLQMDL